MAMPSTADIQQKLIVTEEDEGKTKAKPTLFLHKGEDVDIICVGQCIGIQAEGYGSRPLVKHESG